MPKKYIIIASLVCCTLIIMSVPSLSKAVINFLLVGAIPGTEIVISSWIMIALWCLIITTIVTAAIETTFRSSHKSKASSETSKKSALRLPSRRYSNI